MVSFGKRLKYAFRTFFAILFHGRIADDIVAALVAVPEPAAPVPVAPATPDPGRRATQLLALLQRDGRLIDFVMEDLTPYADAQIGAAVRDVHAGCRQTLTRYFTLEPVIDDEEGRPVTVEHGTDPAAIKVVGNVAGQPPFKGVLRHRGWSTSRIELPPLPAASHHILAPAEVEVS